MRALLDGYHRLLKLLLTLLMFGLVIPVAMQILSRYGGIMPRYIWTEEIARFCFVWIIMIGAMIAVRDGTHFDVDLIPRSANPGVDFTMRMIVQGAILLMAFSFLWWGWDFGKLGARQVSEISGLPMLAIYIAWPVAGATWVLFTVEKIVIETRAFRRGGAHGAG